MIKIKTQNVYNRYFIYKTSYQLKKNITKYKYKEDVNVAKNSGVRNLLHTHLYNYQWNNASIWYE